MARITIDIPDNLIADAQTALQSLYGTAIVGLNAREQLVYHIRVTLGPHIQAIRQAQIDRSALEVAQNQARLVISNAETVIKAKEITVISQTDADIGGIK